MTNGPAKGAPMQPPSVLRAVARQELGVAAAAIARLNQGMDPLAHPQLVVMANMHALVSIAASQLATAVDTAAILEKLGAPK